MNTPRLSLVLLVALLLAPAAMAQSPRDQAQAAMRTLATPELPARERALAAQRLGDLGAWDAVPALTAALEDAQADVRAAAANALYDLKDHAASAVPALTARLSDAEPEVVYAAVLALDQLGTPAPALRAARERLLRDGEPFHRLYTARALADDLPAAQVVPHVIDALRAFESAASGDRAFGDANALLRVLAETDGEAVAPLLLSALDHHHPRYIDAIGIAIHDLRKPLPEAVPKLIAHLGEEARPTHGLMNALLRQGHHARAALPALHARFRSETDEMTRKQLAETMMAIALTLRPLGNRVSHGPADPALVAQVWALIGQAGLDDPSGAVRSTLLRTDSIWGAKAEPARTVLEQAARSDPEPRNRATAVTSLGALGPASLPVLRAILDAGDEAQVLDAARRAINALSR